MSISRRVFLGITSAAALETSLRSQSRAYTLEPDPAGKTVKDPSGRVIDRQQEKAEVPGRNLFVTLDHSIQANAEEVLRATVRKWGAKSASAIGRMIRVIGMSPGSRVTCPLPSPAADDESRGHSHQGTPAAGRPSHPRSC